MDRKKGTGSPPGELGSFDVRKKSEAEIAAQIAARMAQWRRAHKSAAAPARAPPAEPPPASRPPIQQYVPPHPLDEAATLRIERALRIAAGTLGPQTEEIRMRPGRVASDYRTDFRDLLTEGPNMHAAGMSPAEEHVEQAPSLGHAIGAAARQVLRQGAEPRIGPALRRARAIAVTAWYKPMHWPAVAGAALVAAAIAGWMLMTPGRPVAPEVAATPNVAGAPVATAEPLPALAAHAGRPKLAPQAPTPTRQEALSPEKAAARTLLALKSEPHVPTLVARLKPAKPATKAKPSAQATKESKTHQEDTVPLNATPTAPGANDRHRVEQ